MKRSLVVLGAFVATFAATNLISFRVGRHHGLSVGHEQMSELLARRASASTSCVDLAEPPAITRMGAGSSAAPEATGGALTDGVWVMTEEYVYGAEKGFGVGTASATLRITNGVFESLTHDKVLYNDVITRERGTFTVDGDRLAVHVTCPSPAREAEYRFTAEGDRLVLHTEERSGDVRYPVLRTFRHLER